MTPRGIRNKNPGNIRKGAGWQGLAEDQSSDNEFAIFIAPVWGIRALCRVVLTYHRHRRAADGSKIDTVQEIIDRWAPPIENDTNAYAARVRMALDVDKGEIINPEDPDTLLALAAAIIHHENGQQPYSQAELREGVDLALGNEPKPRRLRFGLGLTVALPEPEPIDLWVPKGREKPILTYVLPIESFKRRAVQFGFKSTIGAFAVYKRVFGKDTMFFRVDRYQELALHELRHIIEQRNFHQGDEHA